jgi:hypothetical protein
MVDWCSADNAKDRHVVFERWLPGMQHWNSATLPGAKHQFFHCFFLLKTFIVIAQQYFLKNHKEYKKDLEDILKE